MVDGWVYSIQPAGVCRFESGRHRSEIRHTNAATEAIVAKAGAAGATKTTQRSARGI